MTKNRRAKGCGLELDVVRTAETLKALRQDWDQLIARLGPEFLFSSHAFICANWARHAELPRRCLHVVTLRRDGRLIMAAPMVRQRTSLGTGVLYWLHSFSPLYCDLLCDLEEVEAGLAALRRHLAGLALIRKLKVDCVRDGSQLAGFLADMGASSVATAAAPFVDLPPPGVGRPVSGRFSARRQSRLNYYRRRLDRMGQISHAIVTNPAKIQEAVGWIFARKRDWVIERYGTPNWACEPQTADYFSEIAAALARRGEAWAGVLLLDGRPISGALYFRRGDTVYWSKTAYDPSFGAVSPGWLELIATLEHACCLGVRRFDMMLGTGFLKDQLSDGEVAVRNYRLRLGMFRMACLAQSAQAAQ
jgi:CelD/BcsL family acetyltransferase involved in cellulose biosynthesis